MTEPASIRYKNPGAMWGGNAITKKWGEQGNVALNDGMDQNNHIAVFPTYVQGICAQIDLWRSSAHYRDKRFSEAIGVWSGGNSVASYIALVTKRVPGMTGNTIMNDAFWRGPMAIPFLKAQAFHEAGKEYPAMESDWTEALQTVLNVKPIKPTITPKPKPSPTPAKVLGPLAVLGAALLGAAVFIQTHPIPVACGVIIAVAGAIWLVKRK